jgi:hypothetical protein
MTGVSGRHHVQVGSHNTRINVEPPAFSGG